MSKLLPVLFTLLLVVGCEDSMTQSGIRGEWNLVNVNGGLLGTNVDFNEGTIVWNFGNSMVIVINNNLDSSLADSFDTGQYDYSIQEMNEVEVMLVGEQSLGTIHLEGKTLTIDQRPVDGFQLVFSR